VTGNLAEFNYGNLPAFMRLVYSLIILSMRSTSTVKPLRASILDRETDIDQRVHSAVNHNACTHTASATDTHHEWCCELAASCEVQQVAMCRFLLPRNLIKTCMCTRVSVCVYLTDGSSS